MKNKKSILLGFLASFISIYFLSQLIQLIVYLIWVQGNYQIDWAGLTILQPENLTKVQSVIIFTLPLFFVVSAIHLATNLLKYQGYGTPRFTLLIFIILNVGYLIVNIFIGAFNIILNPAGKNSWALMCKNLEMGNTGGKIFIFIVILLLMNYLKSFTKIVTEYTAYKK